MQVFCKLIGISRHISRTELEKWGIISTGLGIAALVHTFIAEVRYVPSPSMRPTIQVRDRLLIDKLSYRSSLPQRQDIVVFKPPQALSKFNIKGALVKRVIGLPGEKIQVKNGLVYVNDLPLVENYITVAPNYKWGPTIIPAKSYLVLGDNRNQSFDGHNWGFIKQESIIGRTFVRFWPPYRMRTF